MARTFQTDGNPVAARIAQPGTPGDKRQVIPYSAHCDYAGREAQIAVFGETLVGQKQPDISLVFNYFINPERVVSIVSGGGALSIDASRLKVAVTGGAGEAIAESKRNISYRAGHDAFALFTCSFGESLPGTIQEAGAYNAVNGFYISMDGAGLHVNHLVGGVLATVDQGDFNLDKLDGSGLSDITLDPQALNIYRITYGYLGKAPAFFEVYAGVAVGWVPFHVFDITNNGGGLVLTDPLLPIKFRADSDGTNDVAMFSGSWLGGTIGDARRREDNDQFAFDVSKSILGGVETVIGSMRVKTTFQGKPNKIPAEFHVLTAGVEGVKPHIIRIYKNTPLTAPLWLDPIGPTSVVEIDLVGTLTGTAPKELRYSTALGKTADLGPGVHFPIGELRLEVGDTLTFTVFSANNSDVILAGSWEEFK